MIREVGGEVTQGMLEDLLYNPVMAAWVFFRVRLDAFQGARLKLMWFGSEVEDHSGFSSGKTIVAWLFCNLQALLIPRRQVGVIYQTFQAMKDYFWIYYSRHSTELFQSQLGRLDVLGEEEGVANTKEASCWKQHFRNGASIAAPAPNFLREAVNLASWRVNVLFMDEWLKIVKSEAGMAGVTGQLLGRVTQGTFNKNHPIWCNKVIRSATAETGSHPGFDQHAAIEKEQKGGNPDFVSFGFCFKDFSGMRSHTGRSFREEFRDEKRLKSMKMAQTAEKYLAEGVGVWTVRTEGWYTEEMVAWAQGLGRGMGLEVEVRRI